MRADAGTHATAGTTIAITAPSRTGAGMMTRMMVISALALGLSVPALGQQIRQAVALSAPSVYQNETGYSGCGVRVVAVVGGLAEAEGVDFSVVFFAEPRMGGAVKVAGIKGKVPYDPKASDIVPVTDFRLSVESTGVPVDVRSTFPGDDPRYLMAAIEPEVAIETMLAIALGERMQMSILPKGAPFRFVYSFTAALAADDRRSWDACLKGVMGKLEKVQTELSAK